MEERRGLGRIVTLLLLQVSLDEYAEGKGNKCCLQIRDQLFSRAAAFRG